MDYMVYFNIFGWVFLPMLVILALYIEVFYLIRKHIRKNISNTGSRGLFYGKEYKTAKSLALVFLLFAISWLPLSILNCYIYFTEGTQRSNAFKWFIYIAILLSHANSAMNPIVYAFKIKKFKESYSQIIRTYILHKVRLTESSSAEHTLDDISQDCVE
ncbi:unnamed protein product [Staurois parvus]|uniref:G-protein coupled receptors family 1 profile domain-containing protein n=1 Tax=Staurois parvus TaxID=386267 RepID=A0ABN9EQM6_9NEOB|nr:unnamed protein product [Staurois parvus]